MARTKKTGLLAPLTLLLSSCGEDFSGVDLGSEITFDDNRPTLAEALDVAPYTGDNVHVLEAQAKYRTGLDFHRKVIIRTCAVTEGVCHNQKEYPDLHTPSNFLSAIGAPCNVQPKDYTAVYDRCEPVGDSFKLENSPTAETEVGYFEYIAGEAKDYEEQGPAAADPGFHLYVRDPVELSYGNPTYSVGQFKRRFNNAGSIEDLIFANYETQWWVLDDGHHLFAQVQEYQVTAIENLVALNIAQGDRNRNTIFGLADAAPLALIHPGYPEESYLVGRLRGELAGNIVPGTRMPLANEPISIVDMLGLYCWIFGLPQSDGVPVTLESSIDYANCPYSADPENLDLLGEGTSWLGRIRPLIAGTCGASQCHAPPNPQAGLDLFTDTEADPLYERLFRNSSQNPALKYIEPTLPEQSYIYLKVTGASGIIGSRMPPPITSSSGLSEQAILDLQQWILNGALAQE